MSQKRNSDFSFANARREQNRYSGFTLIELMVVLAIIIIITGVIITNQGAFNKTIVLANTAYDVALTIRSAETFGLGNRIAGGVANAGYGVHFQKTTPDTFTLFADTSPLSSDPAACHPNSDSSAPNARPGNCVYDPASGEKVTDYKLGNGITISDFCAYTDGVWSCASGVLTSLDIIFSRPNPNPFMSVNGFYSSVVPITRACITLTSPQGGFRYVSVESSGAINATAPSCP